ncbi:MAG: hypothetical protein OEZ34_12230, partial [Spirochaetia bacterium]|nr:hypothetical protein [Spirochaetia bacterium]
VRAVNESKPELIQPHLAGQFSITMVNQENIKSYDELKQYFHNFFQSENAILSKLTVEPEADVLTVFTGPNTGYNYGHSTDTYELKIGKSITMKSRWTATVIKENGQWKISTLHVGVNMVENPILEIAEKEKYIWGISGFIMAAVMALVFIMLRKKS